MRKKYESNIKNADAFPDDIEVVVDDNDEDVVDDNDISSEISEETIAEECIDYDDEDDEDDCVFVGVFCTYICF